MFDNAHDVCEAYYLLESDYNVSGVLQERKSNLRRNMSTGFQLSRMKFTPRPNLTYDTLTEQGKEIYDALEIEYGFAQQGIFDPIKLKESLLFAQKSIGKDDIYRAVLHNVFFDFSTAGVCHLVGANGYAMHIADVRYTGNPPINFMLSDDSVTKLTKMIRVRGASVEMTYKPGRVVFSQYFKGKTNSITFNTEPGTFPVWQNVVNGIGDPTIELTLTYSTVKMLHDTFSKSFGAVKLVGSDNKLIAKTHKKHMYDTTMHIQDIMEHAFEITFNPEYIYKATYKEENVTIQIKHPLEPFSIDHNNGMVAIIMPMNIKD